MSNESLIVILAVGLFVSGRVGQIMRDAGDDIQSQPLAT